MIYPHTVLITAPPLIFFFTAPATTEIYTLSLHDALPICRHFRPRQHLRRAAAAPASRSGRRQRHAGVPGRGVSRAGGRRSEEHTSELQSRLHLVCRLLLEKKKKQSYSITTQSTSR